MATKREYSRTMRGMSCGLICRHKSSWTRSRRWTCAGSGPDADLLGGKSADKFAQLGRGWEAPRSQLAV